MIEFYKQKKIITFILFSEFVVNAKVDFRSRFLSLIQLKISLIFNTFGKIFVYSDDNNYISGEIYK